MPHDSVAAFIRFFIDHRAGSLLEISTTTGVEETRADAFGEMLSAWGLLRPDRSGWCLIADEENARFFLRAVYEILAAAERPVLENFREEGRTQTWVAVLRALENRRIALVPGADFLRRVSVAQAIILGQSNNDRYVLVEWDTENWHTVKLVGGKAVEVPVSNGETAAERERPVQTISRELREELDERFHETFTLADRPLLTSRADMVSKTRGVRTGYTVHIFSVIEYADNSLLRFRGSRAQSLRWLAVDDLEHGVRSYPAAFFAETFTPAVVAHMREHPIVYNLRPEHLKERQLRLGELIEALLLRADVIA